MVDFIFYNGDTVLVHPNPHVATAEEGNLSLVGTFAKIKKNEIPLTLDEAKDRALNKLKNLGITMTKDDLSAMHEVEGGKFYDIHGDKRYKEMDNSGKEMCSPYVCPIKTQVFSMDVDNPSKFMFFGAEWVKVDPKKRNNIFKGHHDILKKVPYKYTLSEYARETLSGEETYPERDPEAFVRDLDLDSTEYTVDENGDIMVGGRRTRKRRGRKGKKSMKAKKSKKGKKTKKRNKKTHRRRH